MPELRDSQKMSVVRSTNVAAQPASTDFNEQLRNDAKELRSVANTYLIEEGRVFLRSKIPSK